MRGTVRGHRHHAGYVAGEVLAVAVHAQHRIVALPQRLAKTTAQRFTLAATCGLPQESHRQSGNDVGGAIVRAIVHDDDRGAQCEDGFDHAADR